jgi:hypothetical protein
VWAAAARAAARARGHAARPGRGAAPQHYAAMSKLPKGLTLPGVAGQVMVFATKLPALMLPLQSLAITACSTAARQGSRATPFASLLTSAAVLWPVLTALFLSAALVETLCRQWVWYRLLENKVLLDFRHSELGLVGRLSKDRGVWWLLGGWALLAANEFANSPADHPLADAPSSASPPDLHGTMFGLLMMYVFFVTEVESSQLPTVNACIKASKDENLAWLQTSTLVCEAAVAEACRTSGVAFGAFQGWQAVAGSLRQPSRNNVIVRQGLGLETLIGHSFWAMQTLGLPPASGAFSSYQRLRLRHDETDYAFACQMRM